MPVQRILIIDDDQELCSELSDVLEREGYSVDMAFDGRKGEERIKNGHYDLVLLDIKMPYVRGPELLESIRNEKNRPKVMILSASPAVNRFLGERTDLEGNDPEEVLKLADDMMSKPYDVETLLGKIKKIIY